MRSCSVICRKWTSGYHNIWFGNSCVKPEDLARMLALLKYFWQNVLEMPHHNLVVEPIRQWYSLSSLNVPLGWQNKVWKPFTAPSRAVRSKPPSHMLPLQAADPANSTKTPGGMPSREREDLQRKEETKGEMRNLIGNIRFKYIQSLPCHMKSANNIIN